MHAHHFVVVNQFILFYIENKINFMKLRKNKNK